MTYLCRNWTWYHSCTGRSCGSKGPGTGGRPKAGAREMLSFLRRWLGTVEPRPKGPLEGEDPAVTLERTLGILERELAEAGESLGAVAAIRRDLEMRRTRADEMVARLTGQAERAIALGRDDLARQALAARWKAERSRDELQESLAEVDRQQAALEAARDALRQKTEQFRARKAEMDARLSAAEAQLRLQEAMASVSGEVAAVTRAQGRLEEHLEATRARTEALAELAPLGTAIGGQEDPLEREIAHLERAQRVDREMARLKQETMAEKDANEAREGQGEG